MNQRKLMFDLVLILALFLSIPALVSAATLVVDGQFDDWIGQPNVTDPAGDGPTPNVDVLTFYWGNNPDDEHIYWMMERSSPGGGNAKAYYFVFVDANNNGSYTDGADRLIRVFYDPKKNSGDVKVTVYDGGGTQINQYGGDWGQTSDEGGSKAEWRVSFADLGIDAHQAVSMYAGASQNADPQGMDRLPDEGDITWTPIPVLGWPWLILVVAVVIGVVWFTRGRWRWKT